MPPRMDSIGFAVFVNVSVTFEFCDLKRRFRFFLFVFRHRIMGVGRRSSQNRGGHLEVEGPKVNILSDKGCFYLIGDSDFGRIFLQGTVNLGSEFYLILLERGGDWWRELKWPNSARVLALALAFTRR